MSAINIFGLALLVGWAFAGFAFLAWSSVDPGKDYGEACRRHDMAVKFFLPWLGLGYLGIFLFFSFDAITH